jgi:hypothetical protein
MSAESLMALKPGLQIAPLPGGQCVTPEGINLHGHVAPVAGLGGKWLKLASEPLHPRARPLAKMHDRNNQDGVVPDLIDDPVRKTAGPTAASALRKWMPSAWMLKHALQCSFDLNGEFKSKAFTFQIVKGDRFLQLINRWKKESNDHRRRVPILLKTWAAVRVLILPRSNASSRRSASFAQSASIVLRDGNSKLANSFSISSARSMGGNPSAFEKRSRVCGDMNFFLLGSQSNRFVKKAKPADSIWRLPAEKAGPAPPAAPRGSEAHIQNGSGNPFVNLAADNYALTAATAGGIAITGFDRDMLGRVRGADGVWDRGAYEFSGTAAPNGPPAAPRGLRFL